MTLREILLHFHKMEELINHIFKKYMLASQLEIENWKKILLIPTHQKKKKVGQSTNPQVLLNPAES